MNKYELMIIPEITSIPDHGKFDTSYVLKHPDIEFPLFDQMTLVGSSRDKNHDSISLKNFANELKAFVKKTDLSTKGNIDDLLKVTIIKDRRNTNDN